MESLKDFIASDGDWKWLDEQSKITKSMVIEYSFFVKYDEDAGRIVSCDPEIVNINTNNF